jgi:hypothetical protein
MREFSCDLHGNKKQLYLQENQSKLLYEKAALFINGCKENK